MGVIELWDLGNNKLEDFCKTWRKEKERGNSHCDLVYLISDTLPFCDEICGRVHNFTFKYLTCLSDLARDIAVYITQLADRAKRYILQV